MKTNIIIYTRVSTKRQGDSGLGLEAQHAYINYFVTSHDKYNVIQSYTEVASGNSIECKKRPMLCEALKLCIDNGYTLVVAKIDRLSRRTEDALNMFSQLGGRLISCDIPNLDKFTLTLYMAISDREREMISIRTKQALQSKKARNGKIKNSEQGANNLLKTNAQAKAVEANIYKAKNNENNQRAKDIVKLLSSQGLNLQQIADYLNKRKFKSSQGYLFQKNTVRRLLI
jgi:DNA invertase Pin-like site-specific DNA recombinase